MKYELVIQEISQGTVTVEAFSPEEAKEKATKAMFAGLVHWEGCKVEFPSVKLGQK